MTTSPQVPLSLRSSYNGAALIPGTKPASDPRVSRSISRNNGVIRVLLVDDHPVVRLGLAASLRKTPHLQVVGEASDGDEAWRKIAELAPDVVLMDVDMPHTDGVTVTARLRRELPKVKVLLISTHRQGDVLVRILESGACGYVLKDTAVGELVEAIEKIHRGEAYFSAEVAQFALTRLIRNSAGDSSASALTPREKEVLIKIAEGLSNKEVANDLGVGVRTVETHRERLMRKLNLHSTARLTRYAVAKGFVGLF